jgi:hypothetical protein
MVGTLTRRMPVTLSIVLLFWAAAAALVFAADRTLPSPRVGVAVKTLAIILIAFAYMRLSAREATLDHALFVGVTWLLLTIAAELLVTRHFGRSWFELLGSPDSALRNILMFAWIGAPALFAQYRE